MSGIQRPRVIWMPREDATHYAGIMPYGYEVEKSYRWPHYGWKQGRWCLLGFLETHPGTGRRYAQIRYLGPMCSKPMMGKVYTVWYN